MLIAREVNMSTEENIKDVIELVNSETERIVDQKGGLQGKLSKEKLDKIDHFCLPNDKDYSIAVLKDGERKSYHFSTTKGICEAEEEPAGTTKKDKIKKVAEGKLSELENKLPKGAEYDENLGCFKAGESHYDLSGKKISNLALYSLALCTLVSQTPLNISTSIPKGYFRGCESAMRAYETYKLSAAQNASTIACEEMFLDEMASLVKDETQKTLTSESEGLKK